MFTDVTRMRTGNTGDIPEGYNTEQTRATRLKLDTERLFLRYREEHDISDAEALRRLVREALDDTDETLDTVNKASLLAGAAYLVVYLVGGPTPTVAVGGVFITFLILWSTYPKAARTLGP